MLKNTNLWLKPWLHVTNSDHKGTFESVDTFQWLNPEIGEPFFKWAFLKTFFFLETHS